MSQSDPNPHADPEAPADHELTPMETFFDNLFNQHMVVPQTSDEAAPIVHDPAPDDHHQR